MSSSLREPKPDLRRPAYAGMPRAARAAASAPGLVWTDYGFLAGIAIAALIAVDPLAMELAFRPEFRHIALAICAGATLLAVALLPALPRKAAWPRRPLAGPLGVAWPLALFALMAIAGGAYARQQGSENTFIAYGVYAAMLFFSAAMVLCTGAPQALLRGYFAILLPAALVMSAYLVVFFGARQVYHEQIYLVIPMAALAFASRRGAFLRWGGAALFLSMGWFSHKLTAYLLSVVAMAYLALFIWLPRLRRQNSLIGLTAAYWGALGLLFVLAAAVLYATGEGASSQPTGNLDYRMHTYQAAWERFLASPLWGSGFSRDAVEKFTLFEISAASNMLPTHSDLLDLLANGGLLAFGLCAAGLGAIAVHAWRRLLRPAAIDRPEAAYAHALALLSIGAIVVCAFNPILLQPPMALLAWSNLGLLLGLSLRAGEPRAGAP